MCVSQRSLLFRTVAPLWKPWLSWWAGGGAEIRRGWDSTDLAQSELSRWVEDSITVCKCFILYRVIHHGWNISEGQRIARSKILPVGCFCCLTMEEAHKIKAVIFPGLMGIFMGTKGHVFRCSFQPTYLSTVKGSYFDSSGLDTSHFWRRAVPLLSFLINTGILSLRIVCSGLPVHFAVIKTWNCSFANVAKCSYPFGTEMGCSCQAFAFALPVALTQRFKNWVLESHEFSLSLNFYWRIVGKLTMLC